MKILYFTDAHIRGNSPVSRKDSYTAAIEAKFKQIHTLIIQHGVSAVLNGGDLFNTPAPAYALVNQFSALMREWGVPIYSIIGSHDKFGYNDSTLIRTALGILVATGVTTIITEPIEISKGIYIGGTHHTYTLDDDPHNYYMERPENCEFFIQLAHGMLIPHQFFNKYTLVSDIVTNSDIVLCGHYHPGYAPIDVNGTIVMNIGSLGRNEKANRVYSPSVLLIDTDVRTYEIIPLSVTEDVFIESAVNDSADLYDDVETFVRELQERVMTIDNYDIKSLIISIGEMSNTSPDIVNKALFYVEKRG